MCFPDQTPCILNLFGELLVFPISEKVYPPKEAFDTLLIAGFWGREGRFLAGNHDPISLESLSYFNS